MTQILRLVLLTTGLIWLLTTNTMAEYVTKHYIFDGCEGGLFTSQNFPHEYPGNSNYTWEIVVDPGFHAAFNFGFFCIESSLNYCSHDSVTIFYNGTPYDRPFCGDVIPPGPFISTDNQLTVVFITNKAKEGHGFNATYWSEKPKAPTLKLKGAKEVKEGETIVLTCEWHRNLSLAPDLYRLFQWQEVVDTNTDGNFSVQVWFEDHTSVQFTCTVVVNKTESDHSNSEHVSKKEQSLCDPNPCQKGSTCLSGEDEYGEYFICDCFTGLTGWDCGKPKPPVLNLTGDNEKEEGETIVLTCEWHRDPRLVPDLYHLYQGQEVVDTNTYGNFYIQVLFEDDKRVQFTCTVICDGTESYQSNTITVVRQSVCDPNPCQNGGTCASHHNEYGDYYYHCHCFRGLLSDYDCYKPEPPTLNLTGGNQTKDGETISLTCEWHRHPVLVPGLYRLFQGQQVVDTSEDGNFSIQVWFEDDTSVQFTCTVVCDGTESDHSDPVTVDKKVSVCDLQPCQNGGTCVESYQDKDNFVEYYQCLCLVGLLPGWDCIRPEAPTLNLTGSSETREGEIINLTCEWHRDSALKPELYRLYQGQEVVDTSTGWEFSVHVWFEDRSSVQFTCTVVHNGTESPHSNAATVEKRVVGGCEANPCENGGTCVPCESRHEHCYSCHCRQGFEGKTCSTPKAPTLNLIGSKAVKQGDTIHWICRWQQEGPSLAKPVSYKLYKGHALYKAQPVYRGLELVDTRTDGHFHRTATCRDISGHDPGDTYFTCSVVLLLGTGSRRESAYSNAVQLFDTCEGRCKPWQCDGSLRCQCDHLCLFRCDCCPDYRDKCHGKKIPSGSKRSPSGTKSRSSRTTRSRSYSSKHSRTGTTHSHKRTRSSRSHSSISTRTPVFPRTNPKQPWIGHRLHTNTGNTKPHFPKHNPRTGFPHNGHRHRNLHRHQHGNPVRAPSKRSSTSTDRSDRSGNTRSSKSSRHIRKIPTEGHKPQIHEKSGGGGGGGRPFGIHLAPRFGRPPPVVHKAQPRKVSFHRNLPYKGRVYPNKRFF